MLLSSRADFKYDDQTPSNPPAGDGSSGIDRYRNIISEAFRFGAGSDSLVPSRDEDERWNRNSRSPAPRERNERSHLVRKPLIYHLSRDDLRDIAINTLQVLDDGEYFPPGAVEPYDLKTKIQWTDENTRYYGPDAGVKGEILESEFLRINEQVVVDEEEKEGGEEGDKDAKMGAEDKDKNPSSQDETTQAENQSEKAPPAVAAVLDSENKLVDDNLDSKAQAQAQTPPDNSKHSTTRHTPIFIGEYSTLIGARKLHLGLVSNSDQFTNKKIGVLNFASAKQAGGGFRNGSQAQEESLARTSSLFPSLISDAASEFYTHYREDTSNAYYTHAMVYSPGIVIFRDDNGEWRTPVEVDILTSAAVNAGEIRRGLEKEERLRRERLEDDIWRRLGEERRKANEKAMAERQKLREEKAKEKKKAELMKLQKKGKDKNEKKETDKGKEIHKSKGKATDKGKEKEETSVEQEKEDAEKEKEKEDAEQEKEKGEKEEEEEEEEKEQAEKAQGGEKAEKERGDQIEKGEKAEAEKSKENQEEKETDGPECASADGMKNTEESTEAKGTSIQNNQPQPEATLEVNQEFTSSSTISHPLSSQAQPSQATDPDPGPTYALAREAAESQIENIMYDRISRILHLFQLRQIPYLILGSFGTGVFQNSIELVATIFADLLIKPDGRFKNVFETVVFAILGKETLKTFWDVFARADKRAQREMGRPGPCVLVDADEWNGWDGDVEEGEDDKAIRMMRWEARRTEIMEAAQAEADLACFVDAQPYWDADTSQLEVDTLSFAVAQAEVDAAPFIAHADTGVASAEVNLTATDDDEIAEDERMILTEDDEKVDLVSEETTTPKGMIVDDSKDVEMVEVRSLPASHCEFQNGKLNEEEDGDIEMQS